MKEAKRSKFTLFYIISAIIVAVLFVVSFTFAWYVLPISQNFGIVFSKPIVLQLDTSIKQVRGEEIIDGGKGLLPGAKVSVNLGFKITDNFDNADPDINDSTSVKAYIRAKVTVKFDDVTGKAWDEYISYDVNMPSDNITSGLGGDGYAWQRVDFCTTEGVNDYWYVLVSARNNALPAKPGQSYQFLENGYVDLSTKITNDFAEKNVYLIFTVDAIQTEANGAPTLDLNNISQSVWATTGN